MSRATRAARSRPDAEIRLRPAATSQALTRTAGLIDARPPDNFRLRHVPPCPAARRKALEPGGERSRQYGGKHRRGRSGNNIRSRSASTASSPASWGKSRPGSAGLRRTNPKRISSKNSMSAARLRQRCGRDPTSAERLLQMIKRDRSRNLVVAAANRLDTALFRRFGDSHLMAP